VIIPLAAHPLSPLEVARSVEFGYERILHSLAGEGRRAESPRPDENACHIDVSVRVRGQGDRGVLSVANRPPAPHAPRPERVARGIHLDDVPVGIIADSGQGQPRAEGSRARETTAGVDVAAAIHGDAKRIVIAGTAELARPDEVARWIQLREEGITIA